MDKCSCTNWSTHDEKAEMLGEVSMVGVIETDPFKNAP